MAPQLGCVPSERLRRLIARGHRYYKEGRRAQYVENAKKMVYMWRPRIEEYACRLGYPYKKYDIAHGEIKVGDFLCRVAVDYPFPGGKFPSEKEGCSWDPINWAKDYAHLLAHSPAEICPDEKILKDATNEVSWLVLEAYDSLKGYPGNFGVMWHSDIDKDFFRYACDVLVKHRTATPSFLNYDVMRQSLIRQGIKEEDAWAVSHNGCTWYSIPGKQYLCGDWASVNILICFMNAFKKAVEKKITNFDQLWELYCSEVDRSVKALNELVNAYLAETPQVWPEMVVSLCIPECIEKGRDISNGGVPYYIGTVQVIGLANVVDSLYAIKKLVFEEGRITLEELKKALDANYEGYEGVRQMLLSAPKFGNDDDQVDEIATKVVDQLCEAFKKYKHRMGFAYCPQLWSHVGHVYVGQVLGATPDGRKAGEPLAQGGNPMHGRALKGFTAHARSMAKLDFRRLNGGSLQLELDPSVLKVEDPAELLANIHN